MSESGEDAVHWTAQPNDLIGGAVVTTYPHPLSEHDYRRDGDQAKRGYVIAECMTMADAGTIADLLNVAGIERRLAEQFGSSGTASTPPSDVPRSRDA